MRARVARRGAAAARSLPGQRVVEDRMYVPWWRNMADWGGYVLHDAIAPEPPSVWPEVVALESLAVRLEVIALEKPGAVEGGRAGRGGRTAGGVAGRVAGGGRAGEAGCGRKVFALDAVVVRPEVVAPELLAAWPEMGARASGRSGYMIACTSDCINKSVTKNVIQ